MTASHTLGRMLRHKCFSSRDTEHVYCIAIPGATRTVCASQTGCLASTGAPTRGAQPTSLVLRVRLVGVPAIQKAIWGRESSPVDTRAGCLSHPPLRHRHVFYACHREDAQVEGFQTGGPCLKQAASSRLGTQLGTQFSSNVHVTLVSHVWDSELPFLARGEGVEEGPGLAARWWLADAATSCNPGHRCEPRGPLRVARRSSRRDLGFFFILLGRGRRAG